MNRHVERVALRARSWLMSRRRPRRTLVRWACSLRWWWLRIVALVVVVPLVVVRWIAAQVVGFGLVLAGWSPPLTLAGLEDVAPVEFATVPAATSSTSVDGSRVGDDVAARHRLLDRVEAIQAREAAQPQGYYYTPRRRFRFGRALRALLVTSVAVFIGWWLFLFSAAAIGSYAPHVNGPHGVQLPGSTTSATR